MKNTKALTLGVTLLASSMASQAVSVSLFSFTGDPARVDVEITDIGSDLQFDLTFVPGPPGVNDADISGFFGDLFADNQTFLNGLSVTGADVTGSSFTTNSVINLGGGVVLGPAVPFDFGVKIGANGNDDIESTSFVLSHTSANLGLDLIFGPPTQGNFDARLGARLKSSNGQHGSAKLINREPPSRPSRPSPPSKPRGDVNSTGSTLAFLGMGLAVAFGLRRRFGL